MAVLGDPDDGGGLQQLVQHRAQPDALQPHVHEVQEGSQGRFGSSVYFTHAKQDNRK